MAYTGRRVVTGHNADGKSMVLFDSTLDLLGGGSEAGNEDRQGSTSRVFWTTPNLPARNEGTADQATQELATALEDGSLLRVVSYAPGVAPRRHRTASIDYVVVLSGSMEVELDSGPVKLAEGDILIQRGTIHNWVNNGTEPCVMFFAMTGAKSVAVGDGRLWPTG